MRYYILEDSTGDEIGNTYPQTDGMSNNYKFKKIDSVSNLPILKAPKVIPDLNSVMLGKGSNLTDIVSSALFNSYSFLVNSKLKALMTKFNLPKHAFFEATLLKYDSDVKENYFLFHLQESHSTSIDFTKSSFSTLRIPPWELPNWDYEKTPIEINSHDDLVKKTKELKSVKNIVPDRLKLVDNFDHNLDLFTLRYLYGKILISERLKEALEINKISGFQITKPSYEIDL
ncbi:hypothetical protein [Flammeovirga aprica]|uniref:Uncharacterized protein n=1 Tax=Flammeovirga aprica JL-4 TaxID=694437 RepID=A0A7X9S232_9BACT|nr:hypothetical protein [Flammeovirga aprica]NME72947.1 hypothetical protein [Flammeovirga aprica JL-4]